MIQHVLGKDLPSLICGPSYNVTHSLNLFLGGDVCNFRTWQARGQIADRHSREGQGAVVVAAQIRLQRGGEMRLARHSIRESKSH